MSKRLVCGVGINDSGYAVKVWENLGYVGGKQKRKLVWICPFYRTWTSMLVRGYSKKYKTNRPTYEDCFVIKEWHLFSTFRAWMEKQDWEGKQLDKDIIIKGNKVYSPETCVFVTAVVNNFLADCGAARGEHMIGVSWHEPTSKFKAQCCNPFTRKGEYLGLFDTELEAHKAWLTKKLEHAYALAEIQTDGRVSKALIDRYTNFAQ